MLHAMRSLVRWRVAWPGDASAGASDPRRAAPATLLDKGERLFRQGDTAGALRAFDEAAKADPKDARAPYLRGVALEKKGDTRGGDGGLSRCDRAAAGVRRGAQQPGRAAAGQG